MMPAPTSAPPPGYTEPEKQLLQAMVDELHGFVARPDWEQQLPFEVRRSYVLERLGNPVELTLKLYQRVSKSSGQAELKLLLENRIQGTGKERWAAANGGFVLSHGAAPQVAVAIRAYHADIRPVQEQLAQDYRGTFYNT